MRGGIVEKKRMIFPVFRGTMIPVKFCKEVRTPGLFLFWDVRGGDEWHVKISFSISSEAEMKRRKMAEKAALRPVLLAAENGR